MVSYDLSSGSTETKYIKLNTKIQNIFCFLNENLTTFLYTLTGRTRIQKEEKMLMSTRCIHGFMSNLIKKFWTDSIPEGWWLTVENKASSR